MAVARYAERHVPLDSHRLRGHCFLLRFLLSSHLRVIRHIEIDIWFLLNLALDLFCFEGWETIFMRLHNSL